MFRYKILAFSQSVQMCRKFIIH